MLATSLANSITTNKVILRISKAEAVMTWKYFEMGLDLLCLYFHPLDVW